MVHALTDERPDHKDEAAAFLRGGTRLAYDALRELATANGMVPGDARDVARLCGQPPKRTREWLKRLRRLGLVEVVGIQRRLVPITADHPFLLSKRRGLPSAGRTGLYRWFDRVDALLYAGITNSLIARQDAHAASEWMHFAARATIEWFTTRAEAEAAEITAISAERPIFNSVYADAKTRAAAVAAYMNGATL